MITNDRDGLSPVQVARINRLELARYRKPLTEAEQIARAAKVMRRGLYILCVITILGVGILVYIGETTLWASAETKAALPTLEIRP